MTPLQVENDKTEYLVFSHKHNLPIPFVGIKELNWKTSLKIVKQVAEALAYINGKNFVIGDFKPDNILVDEVSMMLTCQFC